MAKYYHIEQAEKLRYDQLVLAKCPNWSSTGFQVCKWNGNEFYYEDQPNDDFNENVTDFMPLNDEGLPIKL